MRFAVPVKEESKRFAAANSETLTSNFAKLEKLTEHYSLYFSRVWNLDETGISAQTDLRGKTRARRFLRRNSSTDHRMADFSSIHRATIMPLVQRET